MADLSTLNEQQRAAVLESINKNVVLLAGAGSGKTHTMVKRTLFLMENILVDPENIMLVTFTNKAAKEIYQRMVDASPAASKMWIGTFHRICIRILRKWGTKLGINYFTILDGKGQKAVIKEILDQRGIENSAFRINKILATIGQFKNNMRRPSEVTLDTSIERIYADTYTEYQNTCWRRRTFDFDDLILYSILLLNDPEVEEWAHNKFQYVMADEVQDTNMAQFVFLNAIAGNNNIMLIGDINQSIYAFRNARPQYLESFASVHSNTVVMKIEQNYRSTQNIINAANAVVVHNSFGTKLEMFCSNEPGELIQLHTCADPYAEARWVVSEILSNPDKDLSDYAIIYRTNAQSQAFERIMFENGIGYNVFGSQSFYTRKDVRDMLAYLKIFINPYDLDAFKRILGLAKGVGAKTIENIVRFANNNTLTLKESIPAYLEDAKQNGTKVHGIAGLQQVAAILSTECVKCSEVVENMLNITGIKQDLYNLGTEDAKERIDIILEFQDMIHVMEEDEENTSMADIVDQISLLSDAKGEEKAKVNCVKLMTAHASKGLEFDTVFLAGAQEGSFPHKNAITENTQDAIEEERRLFYVAMTRAKKKLYITNTDQVRQESTGMVYKVNRSRFVAEIPSYLTQKAF